MMNKKEFRVASNIKATDDEKMIVEGYALRFDTLSNDLGGFVETISPQALKKADLSACLLKNEPTSYVK